MPERRRTLSVSSFARRSPGERTNVSVAAVVLNHDLEIKDVDIREEWDPSANRRRILLGSSHRG